VPSVSLKTILRAMTTSITSRLLIQVRSLSPFFLRG